MQNKTTISPKHKAILTMLAALALLCSCVDTLSEKEITTGGGYEKSEDAETEGKSGTLTVTARVSNIVSRYAMPKISNLVYAAALYKSTESSEYEKFVEGVKAANSDNLIFSFQKADDTSGTFTLEIFAFESAAGADTPSFSRKGALFCGKKPDCKIEDDKITVSETIALKVNDLPDLTGTVSLQIKVPSGCSLEIDDTANFTKTGTSPNFTLAQNGDDISAGVYPVTFTVKKNGTIVHIFTESINVLPGICTDTWWNGNVSSETKDVADIISKTVYVRGVGGWYDGSTYNATAMASDDTNSGSFLSPFKTIQKAVDTIIARNDGTSEYTICVDGTLECDDSTYIGTSGMADFSALDKKLNLTIKALSGTATLDGGARFDEDDAGNEGCKNRIIHANPGTNGILNLTIEKLVIKGGYGSDYNGGAIYIESNATVTMTDDEIKENKALVGGGVYVNGGILEMKNCKVEGNIATARYAGGIYVRNGGKVSMDGGTISGNEVRGSNSSNNNYGGGVYIYNTLSKFTMKSGTISGNNILPGTGGGYGSGVCVSSGTFEMEGGTISGGSATSGGGVYVSNGTFTMSGGELTGNNSSSNGGGVYVLSSGNFTMQGGTISDCTANVGGGIYNNGVLTVDSGTKIYRCVSNASGGGIYNHGTAIISGCTIELCKVTSSVSNAGGGGICNSDGTLTVTGGTISECTAEESYGGGIYLANSSATEMPQSTITDVEFSKCKAKHGGGVYVGSGNKFRMSGATITDCEASVNGGGVRNLSEDAKMTGCTIKSCKAMGIENNAPHYGGGGICNFGKSLIVSGGEISGNHASYNGGGVLNYAILSAGNAITLSNVKISNNTADNYGGGVYNDSTLTLDGGTAVSENEAKQGGGVYDQYVLILNGVTVSQNTATESGGDVYAQNRGLSISAGRLNFYGTTFVGDIYLDGVPRHITAHPDLACASGKTVCATITLPEARYKKDTVVLQAADGETITQDLCDKFAMAEAGWMVVPSQDDDTAGVLVIDAIYLNSSNGSDSNSGLTASKAVKTLSKAIELYESQGSQKIMVCAEYTLPIEESTLLDRAGKTHLTLMRYAGSSDGSGAFTGNLLTISQGSVGILNATLDGNKDNVSASGSLLYIDGATTTVSLGDGATLCNNKTSKSGGAVYINNGTFEMGYGTITGNEARSYGGGVYVGSTSTFEMCGGTISGNEAGAGGGVYIGVTSSAVGTFNISDSAKVESDNDVYLYNIGSNFATITVADALSESPVATITPSSYTAGKQILTADGTNVTAITQDICDKFALSSANANWKIAPNADGTAGVLQLKSN